jgi:hypothetical protein
MCVSLFTDLPAAREMLAKVASVFGGIVDLALRLLSVFSSANGDSAAGFDVFGLCSASCLSHLTWVFEEDVMTQLIAGAVHASEGVRAAAFGMIANVLKALPALGLHDAPLPQIASVILGALELETSVAALSAELGALARFCGYHRGLDLPFAQEILAACDHFGCSPERAHQLAVVACYRDLAESGCTLSERASAFLCGVLQKRPDERLFFKVLASIDTFLDAFPIAIVTAVQAYLSVCAMDALAWKERHAVHRAVFALACRIPDAVGPFGRFAYSAVTMLACLAAMPDRRLLPCVAPAGSRLLADGWRAPEAREGSPHETRGDRLHERAVGLQLRRHPAAADRQRIIAPDTTQEDTGVAQAEVLEAVRRAEVRRVRPEAHKHRRKETPARIGRSR